MAQYGGWTGKVLRVNLTTGKISSEDTIAKYKDFVGGEGLGFKVLFDEVPPGTDAHSPENKIVVGVGPMCGSGAPQCSRHSNVTVAPGTPFNGVAVGHGGGHWASELKFAGWDSVIVEGKAAKPVWICIADDNVSIRDASHLWGNGIMNANVQICDEMGADAEVLAIGQAGEKLNVCANVLDNRGSSARYGSPWGAKNLKAIGVKGTGAVKIASTKQEWQALLEEHLKYIGGQSGQKTPIWPQPWAEYYGSGWTNRKDWFWGAAGPPVETGECNPNNWNTIAFRGPFSPSNIDRDRAMEALIVRGNGCYGCPVACNGCVYDPEIATKYGLYPSMTNTCNGFNATTSLYEDVKLTARQSQDLAMIQMNLADDLGIGHWHHQLLDTFMVCLHKGIVKAKLSEKEYNSIDWAARERGDPKFAIDFYRRFMANREGELGEALAGGPYKLWTRWDLPPIEEVWHDEPLGTTIADNKATWAQFHHHGDWQVNFVIDSMWNRECMIHETNKLTNDSLPFSVRQEAFRRLVGSADAIDNNNDFKPMNQWKAKWGRMLVGLECLDDSLLYCNRGGGTYLTSALKELGYVGDPTIQSREYSALTGDKVTWDQFIDKGVRIFTLFRADNIQRMGTRDMRHKHDLFPERMFDHPDFKDAKPFTKGTNRMDRADMELARDMLYEELGWDKNTGDPTIETYKKLGLEDVASKLQRMNLV